MNKKVKLQLVEPLYSTYHYQGGGCSIIGENPSIKNWYLSRAIMLTCNRKFLSGFTSPEIEIELSSWVDNPCFEKYYFPLKYIKGHVHSIIRELLNNGYYVNFVGMDDYYIEGKSWYKERHFNHDGLIFGYDAENKTYDIYAYDKSWLYKPFQCSWKSFDESWRKVSKDGSESYICGMKPIKDTIYINNPLIIETLKEYLGSNMKKYPRKEEGRVRGTVVHDYIALYIDKLYDGSIPFERKDRRVFRLIWDHKKAILECLIEMEKTLNIKPKASKQYQDLVEIADNMRMLYASYIFKRKDYLLPVIRKKLMYLKKKEKSILSNFIKIAERKLP